MKKTFQVLIALCALAVAFPSCTKEGQYMPKKKISEIVYTRSYKDAATGVTISSTEREVWTWGRDVLNFIDYYDANGNRQNTAVFRCDGQNRIESIEDNAGTAKFDYDNNVIEEIEFLNKAGNESGKVEFEHKGGKVSAITLKGDLGGAKNGFNPLRLFFPETLADLMVKNASKAADTRYAFTWKGNNVAAIEVSGSSRASASFTYDDKQNPFRGFLHMMSGLNTSVLFSANNMLQMVYDGDGTEVTEDYAYTYDGNFPTRMTWKHKTTGVFGEYLENREREYRY